MPPLVTSRLASRTALGCALVVLAACGSAAGAGAPKTSVTGALAQRAALGSHLAFTGTYAVSDVADTAATVRVWVTPGAYRVEVAEGARTAALYGSATGTAACPEQAGQPTVCYAVAAAGKPVPAAFDAGVERVFTRDLATLAKDAAAFPVTEQAPSAAVRALAPDARCFTVVSAPVGPGTSTVDAGTYCLTADGLPVQLRFVSGTLTLTHHGAAPTPAELSVPVAPTALPAGLVAEEAAAPVAAG